MDYIYIPVQLDEIILINNIISDEERERLIEVSKPLLISGAELGRMYGGADYPGNQTLSNLHHNPEFDYLHKEMLKCIKKESGMDLEIVKSWVNWTDGNKKDINWHLHHCTYACVYYMKTNPFLTSGTLFDLVINKRKRKKFVKGSQNSLMLFPGHVLHTAPSSFLRRDRYTLACNLEFKE
tara:strand:- start:194 stop:736 length:543 start_codon:yes stop_codon:yes gene_type:complete